ncbi:MAG: winged helix DNA-binding domain-containing protein [Chloroflexi bacterium]|nr:winged helix DNA-binding domain-containing protein [Chloroflexota bacterium]
MTDRAPWEATREQVLAYRLAQQNLVERVPVDSLAQAAGVCGLQDTPPGSAALALHARVAGLTPADLDRALAEDRTLVTVWSARAAPYVVPTEDAAAFTLGLLPDDEEATLHFIRGAKDHLDGLGWAAVGLVERAARSLPDVLGERPLTKDELGVALAARVSQDVPAPFLPLWNAPDGYRTNRYGETLVRFALSVVSLQGLLCIAPRQGNVTRFLCTETWLGAPLIAPSIDRERADIVRRYLRCYGPSTPGDMAAWAGISPAQAARAWALVEGELTEVRLAGRKTWLLAEDLPALEAPPEAEGVRLLPPHDPYLLLRDHATLAPERAVQRLLWRTAGNPGVVLVDGRLVAAWRPQKAGRRLGLRMAPLADLDGEARAAIDEEAQTLAPWRGCDRVELIWEGDAR